MEDSRQIVRLKIWFMHDAYPTQSQTSLEQSFDMHKSHSCWTWGTSKMCRRWCVCVFLCIRTLIAYPKCVSICPNGIYIYRGFDKSLITIANVKGSTESKESKKRRRRGGVVANKPHGDSEWEWKCRDDDVASFTFLPDDFYFSFGDCLSINNLAIVALLYFSYTIYSWHCLYFVAPIFFPSMPNHPLNRSSDKFNISIERFERHRRGCTLSKRCVVQCKIR